MRVNVYARELGWLFSDLKQHIASHGAIPSESPIPDADAYICIRDSEAHLSPKPDKTVVQVHHINPVDLRGFGMISFCHPYQERQYREFDKKTPSFTLPIGARDIPVTPLPDKPTLGGFFREVNSQGKKHLKGSLLFAEAVEIARKTLDFDVLLIGGNLDHIKHIGRYEKRAATPDDYARITALMTTSTSPCVPLSAYEALAAGRPVISTPREWTHDFSNIGAGKTAKELAACIVTYLKSPILIPQKPFDRDEWCKRQVKEAINLI